MIATIHSYYFQTSPSNGGVEMIISSKQLTHYSIQATDDAIGGVRDILFDDQTFVVRYLVADTNTWLPLSRKVVISPISVSKINIDDELVHISMSVNTLKNSPSIDEHKPVSREYEESLFKYFGYGYYWVGPGAWGEFAHPNELVDAQQTIETKDSVSMENHLRACNEINGYEIATTNGNLGHISSFIVDTKSWKIILLIVDTNNWLPGGKRLALLPCDIKQIDWAAHCVDVDLSHDELEARPQIEEEKLNDADYVSTILQAIKD